jgi:FKBP-type peptidyl-prolyl cis-trans isomerase SlyD
VGELTIRPNTYVTLDYELRGEDDEILDASEPPDGEPIRYVHGYGMLVPGLEAALTGLHAGDEREVLVPVEGAYGEYDESLLLEVARSELPDPANVQVGDEFTAESPDGDEMAVTVQSIHGERVTVDANHPLAGMALKYRIKVLEVREATDQEVEHAAAGLDEAHEHVHGPDCAHSHDSAHEGHDLVTLGEREVN